LNSGNIITSTNMSPQITFPGLGSYTGQLIISADTLNCSDTVNILINIINEKS